MRNTKSLLPTNQSFLVGNGNLYPFYSNGRLYENVGENNYPNFLTTLLAYLAVYSNISVVNVSTCEGKGYKKINAQKDL